MKGLGLTPQSQQQAGSAAGLQEGRIGGQANSMNLDGYEAKAIVRFTSEPAGAVVLVDGTIACQATPCSASLFLGVHRIQLQMVRYDVHEERIQVTGDRIIKTTLSPQFGWLTVTTIPAGLSLKVNQQLADAERRVSEISNKAADKLQVYDEQVRAVQSRAFRSYQEASRVREEADALLKMLDSGNSPLWSKHVVRVRVKIEKTRRALDEEIRAAQSLQGDVARRTIMAPVIKAVWEKKEMEQGGLEILTESPCHVPTGEAVVIRAGEHKVVEISPPIREAGLTIEVLDGEGNPIRATVYADNIKVGSAPGTFRVPFCVDEFRVDAGSGREWTGQITLVEGAVKTFSVKVGKSAEELFKLGEAADSAEDYARAVVYYRQACESGEMDGCRKLKVLYFSKNAYQAVVYYRQACEGGEMFGCTYLGIMYQYGDEVVPTDAAQAVVYYRQACEGGFAQGCDSLGFMYANGEGVSKDAAQARVYYGQACRGGMSEACLYD
jgi:hypothetical protein